MNPGARLHRHEFQDLNGFADFLRIDLRLNELTVKGHVLQVKRLLKWLDSHNVNEVSRETLRGYLKEYSDKNVHTYSNVVKTLKRLFRDYLDKPELVESFRLPKKPFQPKRIPTREDLQRFYEAIDSKIGKALFLMYASSGLRKHELPSLRYENVDFQKRMLLPNCHLGETKQSFVSFYNEEGEKALTEYLETRKDKTGKLFRMGTHTFLDVWKKANNKTGLEVTPQTLREWFCSEMVSKGISDSYVDAFCGRIPRSILAKHYLDYSPDRLKAIYDKAALKVLSSHYGECLNLLS